MKWVFITICLVVLGRGWCIEDEEEEKLQILFDDNTTISTHEEVMAAVKRIIHSNCEEVGGKAAITNLENAVEELKTCVKEHLPDDVEAIKNKTDDICEERPKIRGCFEGLIKALEGCTEEDEKFVPEFVFNAIDGLFDFACGGDLDIKELFTQDCEIAKCVEHLKAKKGFGNACDAKIKYLNKIIDPKDINITKEELCSDLQAIHDCVGDQLQEECPKETLFKKVVTGTIKAISKSCQLKKAVL